MEFEEYISTIEKHSASKHEKYIRLQFNSVFSSKKIQIFVIWIQNKLIHFLSSTLNDHFNALYHGQGANMYRVTS